VGYFTEEIGFALFFNAYANDGPFFIWICFNLEGYAFGDLFNDESHWILAFYFMQIAKTMPKLNSQPGNTGVQPITSNKWVFWLGVVLNALFPVVEAADWYKVYKMIFVDQQEPPLWLSALGGVASAGVGLMQIVSGAILIWAVLSIRSFVVAHSAEGHQLNQCTLLLHVSAFGLYLVSVLVNTVIASLNQLVDSKFQQAYFYANTSMMICWFIS